MMITDIGIRTTFNTSYEQALQMFGVLQENPAVKAVAAEAKTKLERVISSLK